MFYCALFDIIGSFDLMHVLKLPYHFKEGIKMDFPSSLDDQQIEKKEEIITKWGFSFANCRFIEREFIFFIF